MNEIRGTDVELHWRASALTRALLTCVAVALALAVIASRWALIAFVAPLLGVLCSVGWQSPAAKFRVCAQPGAQRCFENENADLMMWLTAEPDAAPGRLTVTAPAGMHVERVGEDHPRSHAVIAAAERWGRYRLRARVDVVARGGLLAGTGTVEAADVVVFPLAAPEATPIPRTELPDRLGTHLTRHTGRGVEYADIRAYVPGDTLRMVNWPVSARRGRLHVTQRLTDRAADVVVLVDRYPQSPGPATTATERTVRGAAQVVQTALRNGDRAGVVTLGGRRPRWLGADIGQRQFYRVIDAVVGAGDDFETTTGTLAPRAAVPAGSIVVAFSTLLDTEFMSALLDLRQRGHVVVAVDVLADTPLAAELDPLMARMWGLQRLMMYRDMAMLGVDVVSWRPEQTLEQSLRLVTERRDPMRG